jgi:hypothetical protein
MSGISMEVAPSPRVCGGSPQNRRGYLVEPQNEDRGSVGKDGIRPHREASKRATHDMIEVLTLGGRECLMDARLSNGELHVLTKMPL